LPIRRRPGRSSRWRPGRCFDTITINGGVAPDLGGGFAGEREEETARGCKHFERVAINTKKDQKPEATMFKKSAPPEENRVLAPNDSKDSRIGDFLAYWSSKRQGRTMPSRQDIDPAEICPLLPFVALVDVIPDVPLEQRYRVRLFGTQLVEFHKKDWTGRSIFDVLPQDAAQRMAQAGEFVVNHRRPWIASGKLYWVPSKTPKTFETVVVPLSPDDSTVNMLFSLLVVL
jgi:hypothetical protein